MKPKPSTPESRYRAYLQSELEAAALYAALADAERDPDRAEVFRELARGEMRHASRWAEKLGISKESLSPTPDLRTRFLGFLARRFGTGSVLPLVLRGEFDDIHKYVGDPEAAGLPQEERGHARALGGLATAAPQPAAILGRERWHRTGAGGSLRAAVLGANDGLVSNFGLVMGVAGGTMNPQFVTLAGVAGLLAGAFSMAAGEYVSMRAQREMYEHQIGIERAELEEAPQEEQEELALIYRAKGLSPQEAEYLAQRIIANPKVALDTLAREELGLDPSELGSPWGAAFSSFVAFAGGALVPVLPYLVGAGSLAFTLSMALSAAALALVGGVLSFFTGRVPLRGSARMLLGGGLAAGVTYAIGRLIGVTIAG